LNQENISLKNNQLIKQKLTNNLNIKFYKGKTVIYIYCVNKLHESNNFTKINCQNLTPITSHVYEISNNTINLWNHDFELIGNIDFVMKYKFKNCSMSYQVMPVPNNLIYSHLNLKSKNKYNMFKKKYNKKGIYKIEFFQLINI
jgi:hypothetical protein